ncbi:MAG: hypothetical protein ABIR70_08305 [Bryobacteraceae bacterium]
MTQHAAATTLEALAEETLELQRELQRLLDAYPEEHLLDGERRIQDRILSPDWRPDVGTDHGPFGRRYWEWAEWAACFRDYIKRLGWHFLLTEESNVRFQRLPLNDVRIRPAAELLESLGLQAAMLRRWSLDLGPKAGKSEGERSVLKRQPRSVEKARQKILREVEQFKGLQLSHLEICKRLDDNKIDTPRGTKWSHLGWEAAYKSSEFRAAVHRWLSGILAN